MRKKTIPFEGKLLVKSGDTVIVTVGKDRGKTGKILKVWPKTGKVLVEGLNVVTQHVKAQPTQEDPNPQGGRVEKSVPLAVNKVSLMNAEGKPTRVKAVTAKDGTKTRIAVKGGTSIPEPGK